MNTTEKLAAAVWEADRHQATLVEALAEWDKAPVRDWKVLESDRGCVRLIDQLLFRFIKLQDSVGERLIPVTLAALGEPYEDRPMRDRLNRLERLGYLNVADWLAWREVRNRLRMSIPTSRSCVLPPCWRPSTPRAHWWTATDIGIAILRRWGC